jgi:hypothetical protein
MKLATITQFGIPGLGDSAGTNILHPKMKQKWNVTFANIAGGAGAQSTDLSVQAITLTRPVLTFEEVQLDRYNSRAWVAGKHTFEPMTITFEDDVTSAASKVIQDQLQKQQWLIGAEGPFLATAGDGAAYKFATTLNMFDGAQTVLESWKMSGCWIQNVDYTDLDYASSDAVQITVTLRYDLAVQDLGGWDGGRDGGGEGVATGGNNE